MLIVSVTRVESSWGGSSASASVIVFESTSIARPTTASPPVTDDAQASATMSATKAPVAATPSHSTWRTATRLIGSRYPCGCSSITRPPI